MRARVDRWGVVVMLVQNLQLPLLAVFHLENDQLEGASCRTRACVQSRRTRLVVSQSITMTIMPCFDIRSMRLASLKNKPGAVLHAMHLESIVCLSVEVIEKLQRGRNGFHGHIRRTGDE